MNEDKQNKKSPRPDTLKWVIIGLIGFVIIILTFHAGVRVGGLKAEYSYNWADNYHKNFAGPKSGFSGNWRDSSRRDFIEGHGAFGEIIELNDTDLIIKGRSDMEKLIIINENTIIKQGRETVENGLQVGDRVTIIGSPNEEGQIEAKLIRNFNGRDKDSHKRSKSH